MILNDKIYFDEMTFYHGSGYSKFDPESFDEFMGDFLDINKIDSKYIV